MTEILDLFEGLTPSQARKFRQEAITRLEELRKEIENNQLDKKDNKTMDEKEANELKKRLALKAGLPGVFAEWLRGETTEEIERDAEKLINFIGTEKLPLDIQDMSPSEIRANSDDLWKEVQKGWKSQY